MSYNVDPIYGCHLWTGRVDKDGYPLERTKNGLRRAYALAWVEAHGPIPEGKELDHLCRNRLCVRPSHFELVTRRENLRRRRWDYRAAMASCPKGHSIRRYSLRTRGGGYVCKACNRGES